MSKYRRKFTVIYRESLFPEVVRMKRFDIHESETVYDALTRLGVQQGAEYLFHGWPKMKGEK